MRRISAIFWLLFAIPCSAGEAELGNYIVVRGAVLGCEAWTDRILEIVKIESEAKPTVLGIPDIEVLGSSEEQIKVTVSDAIEKETGTRPQSLSIELINSVPELRPLVGFYAYSLQEFKKDECPMEFKHRKIPGHYLEEQIEKLRREILGRSVV